MTSFTRLLTLAALGVAVTVPLAGARSAPAAPPGVGGVVAGPKVFRTTCIACHSQLKDGSVPRLEGIRTTPDEWDHILARMGRRGYTLSDAERHALVKEISRYQSLSPAENAAVGYMHVSPAANLQEKVPSQDNFQRACTSCHAFGKIASYRRTEMDWKELKNFHMGMFPAALTQSYRDMVWWDSADSAVKYLAKRFPYAKKPWGPVTIKGTWVVAGHAPGLGDYDATMTFTPKGDDEYTFTRAWRLGTGHTRSVSGTATLYGGGALRCKWTEGKAALTAAYTVAPAGETIGKDGYQLEGSWIEPKAIHHYGTERGLRSQGAGNALHVLRLAPAYVTWGQGRTTVVATTDAPAPAGWRPYPADKGIKVLGTRRIDDHHTAFTLQIGTPKRGRPSLGLVPLARRTGPWIASDDRLTVARGVDYIKITPGKALARLGGLSAPPDGVNFEAIAMSSGPDGKRHTGDDIALGPVDARWELQEFFFDTFDDDVPYVGKIDQHGLFMPGNEAPVAGAPNGGRNGNVWVVATYARPGKAPLTARAYLDVAFPDSVKAIR